jgi:phosphoglycolate phosphatase-like HAD superfamily hydrolase
MGRKIVFFDFDGVLADSFGAAFTVNESPRAKARGIIFVLVTCLLYSLGYIS